MLESPPFIGNFPYLGIFLLLILGGIGLPFPEDATLILSGFLMAHDVIKPLPAFFVIYPSLLLADFSLYSIGKKYGRMLVEHKRLQKIISPDRLVKIEKKFQKWGSWFVFLGRHFIGFRAQVFLVAGMMRIPAAKFILADATSALVTIALMVGIGYAGGQGIQVARKDLIEIGYMAIGILGLLLASWVLFGYFKKERK